MVNEYTAAAIATIGVAGGLYTGYRIYQSLNTPSLPREWKQVGTLSDIYIYPIKSCAPVKLEKAECSILGLRQGWLRDRILMVTNDKYNFITARAYPELLSAYPSVKSSVLTVKNADMEPLYVNLAEIVESNQEPKMAECWNIPVPVYDCGSEANEWFTKSEEEFGYDDGQWTGDIRLLHKSALAEGNFRLVYYASHKSRSLRENTNKVYKFTKNDTGAFPDETPFNLINEASVQDLNGKLQDPVTHLNFRPNFVLKGASPYDEDKWKFVKIGENVFEIIKPCTRCVLTTIDPETGIRSTKGEPLVTLKSYRQVEDPAVRRSTGDSPRMGIQMSLRSGPGGMVSLNDPIYVS